MSYEPGEECDGRETLTHQEMEEGRNRRRESTRAEQKAGAGEQTEEFHAETGRICCKNRKTRQETEKENAYEYRYREQKRGRKRDRAGT